jgi:hypothetical protein
MTQDTIKYAGKEYPVRNVNGYLFATTELAAAILGDHDLPMDEEAEAVDDEIAYFITPEDFEVLTDREAWIQCYEGDEDFEEEED